MMVVKFVAAGCSKTHSDGVSLFKFPGRRLGDRNGSDKSREQGTNGMGPVILVYCAAIILKKHALSLPAFWLQKRVLNSG